MTCPPKHCLLVVDDEPEICQSVCDLLHTRYRVLTATGADAGIAAMAHDDVHLIMTDQRMPEVTGVEMLQKIRCRYPAAIRLLFTGYSDIQSVIAAINQGHVYRYISKPWQPEELIAAVDDAAAEYDRLVSQTDELARCHQRIRELEQEVESLRGPARTGA